MRRAVILLAPPPEAPSEVTAVQGRLFAWGRNLQAGGRWTTSLKGPSSGKGFLLVSSQDDSHGVALDAEGAPAPDP